MYPKGINAIIDNWGSKKAYINVNIIGYPINKVTRISKTRKAEGWEHADAKVMTIDSHLIQNERIAEIIAFTNLDLWGIERQLFTRTVQYDPRLRPGVIVTFSSQKSGYSKHLFYIPASIGNLTTIRGGECTSQLSPMIQV